MLKNSPSCNNIIHAVSKSRKHLLQTNTRQLENQHPTTCSLSESAKVDEGGLFLGRSNQGLVGNAESTHVQPSEGEGNASTKVLQIHFVFPQNAEVPPSFLDNSIVSPESWRAHLTYACCQATQGEMEKPECSANQKNNKQKQAKQNTTPNPKQTKHHPERKKTSSKAFKTGRLGIGWIQGRGRTAMAAFPDQSTSEVSSKVLQGCSRLKVRPSRQRLSFGRLRLRVEGCSPRTTPWPASPSAAPAWSYNQMGSA